MKVSYNWLKQFVDIDIPVERVCEILTDTGLEVEGKETYESIQGGLKGFVIGYVVEKQKHPDADKLSLTKVDIGTGALLDIVCGAPNVAAGQKVVVATIGTNIYGEQGVFTIKKSKIRGALSEGMICAEDELGIGKSHDGIMVLPEDALIGLPAAEYFKIESDEVIEIGLTPNRSDAMSHYGVARDLVAALNSHSFSNDLTQYVCKKPSVDSFHIESTDLKIEVEVKDTDACPRYSGISIQGLEVKESPKWLQDRLKSIGLSPINNVVDVTNYVLHETGQPLHAFDADKIQGNKIIVKKAHEAEVFITLDGQERKLTTADLMICNEKEAMCIAGVFGGLNSGVQKETTNIFIESAYFNPVSVRKTAKHHGLKTDSSFRFERGVDPNNTIYALKRAAILIKELAGGEISSDIIDIYPQPIEAYKVNLDLNRMKRFVGHEINKDHVLHILKSVDIQVVVDQGELLGLAVPTYRVDVQREADVIEEIIRIYGLNNIPIPERVTSAISPQSKPNQEEIKRDISRMLVSNGFYEIMNNSLTGINYYDYLTEEESKTLVKILNPLSNELNVMRQHLIFGGLESVQYNVNRKQARIKFFELGKVYTIKNAEAAEVNKKYQERQILGIWASGALHPQNWNNSNNPINIYYVKNIIINTLNLLGIQKISFGEMKSNDLFALSSEIILPSGKVVGQICSVSSKLLKKFDIKQEVFYAQLEWDEIIKVISKNKITYQDIPKFPAVRRDLALLMDRNISFAQIEQLAYQTERKILKEVGLFDVYEGDKLPEGKKSYAVNFMLQDESQTLTDKIIDKTMERLIQVFEKELGAQIR